MHTLQLKATMMTISYASDLKIHNEKTVNHLQLEFNIKTSEIKENDSVVILISTTTNIYNNMLSNSTEYCNHPFASKQQPISNEIFWN